MKFENIIKLKLNDFKIELPKTDMIEPNPCGEEGYVAYGTKIVDGREVPNCIPDPEQMKKIVKDGFPIPSPSSEEDRDAYVSRCVSSIIDEYGQEQALAICITKYDEK